MSSKLGDAMIFITADIQSRTNSRGEYFTTITLLGEDGRDYHTYIVDGYKNERLWEEILSDPTSAFALKHTRLKKGKIRQLDADVRPTMVTKLNSQELQTLLSKLKLMATV